MQLCAYQCAFQAAVGNCQLSQHSLLRQRFRLGVAGTALATATDVHTSTVAWFAGHMAC